jgi:hypothetical protein
MDSPVDDRGCEKERYPANYGVRALVDSLTLQEQVDEVTGVSQACRY